MERRHYMDERDDFWQYPLEKCTKCRRSDTSTVERKNRKGVMIVEVYCDNCNTVVKSRVTSRVHG